MAAMRRDGESSALEVLQNVLLGAEQNPLQLSGWRMIPGDLMLEKLKWKASRWNN